MSEEIELKLLREIEELKKEVAKLKGEDISQIPIYQYSKMRDTDLRTLVDIEKKIDKTKFQSWFSYDIVFGKSVLDFLNKLIQSNEGLIFDYNEEDLKMYFLSPLLNHIDFKLIDKNIRGFFEEKITYKTEKFIFSGEIDFIISKGLTYCQKPYFFIQEFKRSEEYGNPRPQLLAELISAVELNNYQSMKGAYIIGAIWNFVVLERLDRHKYLYYVSQNFDSTKMEDLKMIYKNLLFIKDEIIKISEESKNEKKW